MSFLSDITAVKGLICLQFTSTTTPTDTSTQYNQAAATGKKNTAATTTTKSNKNKTENQSYRRSKIIKMRRNCAKKGIQKEI